MLRRREAKKSTSSALPLSVFCPLSNNNTAAAEVLKRERELYKKAENDKFLKVRGKRESVIRRESKRDK
jgi:hypothetical protein